MTPAHALKILVIFTVPFLSPFSDSHEVKLVVNSRRYISCYVQQLTTGDMAAVG